jgi:hypothetical protein
MPLDPTHVRLKRTLLLPVDTVNCVQTLKAWLFQWTTVTRRSRLLSTRTVSVFAQIIEEGHLNFTPLFRLKLCHASGPMTCILGVHPLTGRRCTFRPNTEGTTEQQDQSRHQGEPDRLASPGDRRSKTFAQTVGLPGSTNKPILTTTQCWERTWPPVVMYASGM